MAWDDQSRAQLGEQSSNEKGVRASTRSRDVSDEHRGQPVERETIGERGKGKKIDTTAGDEGIDESSFTGNRPRPERSGTGAPERSASSNQQRTGSSNLERSSESSAQGAPARDAGKGRDAEQGTHRMASNQPGTIEQASASTRKSGERKSSERSSERRGSEGGKSGAKRQEESGFAGQGGQKGGSFREDREGTGYTGDRRGQLQHDDSLSGSQGRHGRSGSRHGASGNPQTGTSEKERVGGQTAQNPRTPRKDD